MRDDDRILELPWPPALHPARAGFRRRTETLLRREGVWADMTLLANLTEGDVLGWETAGVRTLEDLRENGNAAVVRYHEEVRRRAADEAEWRRITDSLAQLVAAPWTVQVWRRDPRFANLLPPRLEVRTIRDLALRGTDAEKRLLWGIVDSVEARLAHLAAQPSQLAVAGYVEAISSQHGIRLETLLACTGLNGRDPVTQRKAARSPRSV